MRNQYFQAFQEDAPSVTQQAALVFHTLGQDGGSAGRDSALASWHPVEPDRDGTPVIGAGRLMSMADLEALLRSVLKQQGGRGGLLPPEALSVSGSHLAWTLPAGRRPMIFRTKGAALTTLDVPWPRLLLVATASGRLGLAALRGVRRPGPASRVYHAPLMNVWASGLVCTGSADLPEGCGLADRAAWEAVVTATAFSHVNQPRTLRLDGAGEVTTPAHLKFWKTLSRNKADKFPPDRLVPMGRTVADFIEAFVEKHQ